MKTNFLIIDLNGLFNRRFQDFYDENSRLYCTIKNEFLFPLLRTYLLFGSYI